MSRNSASFRNWSAMSGCGGDCNGADVVEVSPPYDGPGQITALLAANLLFEIVSLLALQK